MNPENPHNSPSASDPAAVIEAIKALLADAGRTMASTSLADNGPVCRDVRRLCEQLRLAIAALDTGRDAMDQPVTPAQVGEALRQEVGQLIQYGTWMRIDAQVDDDARQALTRLRDASLDVVRHLTAEEVEPLTSPPRGTADLDASTVKSARPGPLPTLEARLRAPTEKSTRPPPALPGNRLPDGAMDTLNLRRLGDQPKKPAAPASDAPRRPATQPPQPESPPIQVPASLPSPWPRRLRILAIVIGLSLIAAILIVTVNWLGHQHLWHPGTVPPSAGVNGGTPVPLEPLPENYTAAPHTPAGRLALIEHLAAVVKGERPEATPTDAAARMIELYQQFEELPDAPLESGDQASARAREHADKAMDDYPPFPRIQILTEARRHYTCYQIDDRISVTYQVNPQRTVTVSGKYGGKVRDHIIVDNRQILLDDILVSDPEERLKFDPAGTREAIQAYVLTRERAYVKRRDAVRRQHFEAALKEELAAVDAANARHGYIRFHGKWLAPEALALQLWPQP